MDAVAKRKEIEKDLKLAELAADNKKIVETTNVMLYSVIGGCALFCMCCTMVGMYFYFDYRKRNRELDERLKMNMMFNKFGKGEGPLRVWSIDDAGTRRPVGID